MNRESVIFKLNAIDKENLRIKLANNGLITMQDYFESHVQQYLKEDSHVKEVYTTGIKAPDIKKTRIS